MQRLVAIHNAIDPKTGRTYKEENMELQHGIPIGTLVEARWDAWLGKGACWKVHARLWVVAHTRDCDGTPLYSISQWRDPGFAIRTSAYGGFSEDQLTPIEVTDELNYGIDALEWEHDIGEKP